MGSTMARRARGGDREGAGLSSVANAILLMKTFTDEHIELRISELAARRGLPRSTVHRLASTLVEAGLLEHNEESGKYRLGIVLFELGSMVRRRMDVAYEAKPSLLTLREQTGETVNLSIIDHGSVMCVHFLESTSVTRIGFSVGARRPVHCTAEGKVLIAFQPSEAIEQILSTALERRTPRTKIDPAVLRDELAAIRTCGYAIDDEEYETGVRAIAAPVRDESGNAVAAVGIACPAHRLTKTRLRSLTRFVTATAKAISMRLGARPQPLRTVPRSA